MKTRRIIFCFVISLVLIIDIGGIIFAKDLHAAFTDIKLLLNENIVDKEVLIVDGVSYLPIRAIGEVLGLQVEWNEEKRTINLKEDNAVVKELKEKLIELEVENKDLKEQLSKLNIDSSNNKEEVVVYPGNGIEHMNYYEGSSLNKFAYSYNDNKIKDNLGNSYDSYLTMYIHNNNNDNGWNRIVFPLKRQYKSFKAILGLTDEYKDFEGTIILEVYRDNFKIYTHKMQSGDKPINIDLNITEAEKIKFSVSTKGKTNEVEIGLFNARFIRNN